MQYKLTIETESAEGVDMVGLTATIVYVLSTQLKQVPGVTGVTVTEATSA